ncbi:MAG: DUF2129 domain-containing protein [bacterium]
MRTAVIAHYNNHEFIKGLDRNIFTVYYNSKRYNYVYLYFNLNNKDRAISKLKEIEAITEIEPSLFSVEDIIIKA